MSEPDWVKCFQKLVCKSIPAKSRYEQFEMFSVTNILEFISQLKCLSETNWCVILAFRVSAKYRLREPDGHVCLCKSASHSKRPLKNLGWHHQVHILFVQLYAVWIEFQLKTWVNKSSTRTHTNLWVNTQTWVCACPHKHKHRQTHMAAQRTFLRTCDVIEGVDMVDSITPCHWMFEL